MKHSLHLGLNRLGPGAYGGWPALLNACENDATGLAAALSARGFNARLRLNENCTGRNFRDELTRLALAAAPGDLVVISYSGHGGQEYSLSEADGFNETFCFFDGQVVDDEFARLLAQFAAGVQVVVVLDCCHAGGQDRELAGARGFRPARRVAPAASWRSRSEKLEVGSEKAGPKIGASVALFCACQEKETASDGDKFGAWTGALLDALEQPDRSAVDVRTWFAVAAANCPQGQHPVLRPLGETGVLNQIIQ